MSKVQEYLKNKRIKESGLPTIWVIESDRTGVKPPIEIQVEEKVLVGHCQFRNGEKCNIPIYRYKFSKSPYYVEIYEDETSSLNQAYGSGFGDLWSWSTYSSLVKEEAKKYYENELERVTRTYINKKKLIDHMFESARGYGMAEGNGIQSKFDSDGKYMLDKKGGTIEGGKKAFEICMNSIPEEYFDDFIYTLYRIADKSGSRGFEI